MIENGKYWRNFIYQSTLLLLIVCCVALRSWFGTTSSYWKSHFENGDSFSQDWINSFPDQSHYCRNNKFIEQRKSPPLLEGPSSNHTKKSLRLIIEIRHLIPRNLFLLLPVSQCYNMFIRSMK